MASWKLPKDPGKDHYASAVLSRLKTFEKPIYGKLEVTRQMHLNLQTIKGNRYAQAHTAEQQRAYRDLVLKHLPGMLKEIEDFEKEYKKYLKHLKEKKIKPDKKVEKQYKDFKKSLEELTGHVKEIEAHRKR